MSEKLFRHPAIQLIRYALQREWQQQLVLSFVLFLCSMTLLYWTFGRLSLLAAFAAVGVMVSLVLISRLARRSSPDQHPLMILLQNEPQKVVWVYSVVTQRMPFGIQLSYAGLLYFKLDDGDDFCISLPKDKLKMTSRTLNRMLPNAVFGYTEDREKRYIENPKNLMD